MSEPKEDPIDGSAMLAYETRHRVLGAVLIQHLQRNGIAPTDVYLIGIAIIDLMATTTGSYSYSIDNAIAALAQLPGTPGGPGAPYPRERLAAAVLAECERIYAERVAVSPRVS